MNAPLKFLLKALPNIHIVILLGRHLFLRICTPACASRIIAELFANVDIITIIARRLAHVAIGLGFGIWISYQPFIW
jgi:hypothetical protein